MFLEFLYRFLSFDLDWLISLALDPHSLFWIFLIAVAAHFNYVPKKFFWAFAFFFLFNWTVGDMVPFFGWMIVPGILGVFFAYQVFAAQWIVGDKDWDKYAPWLVLIVFISLWAFFALRGPV